MRECAALILNLTPASIAQRILAYAAILEMWYNRFGSMYCCGDVISLEDGSNG
jgi:hypothetical protein